MGKRFLTSILLLGGLFFTTAITANSDYHNDTFEYNVKVPRGWDLNEKGNGRYVDLNLEGVIATVNITVYRFNEDVPVTVNGFQIRRMTSLYDGWHNLKERQGSEGEISRANVDDSYVAVYSKHILGQDLKVQKHLVAEYYYLKDQVGYVISIKTPWANWPSIKGNVKDLVDSFWVGEGSRPRGEMRSIRSWTDESADSTMAGLTPQNQNRLARSRPTDHIRLAWKKEFNVGHRLKHAPNAVFMDKMSFSVLDKTLYGISLVNGQEVWAQDVGGTVSGSLAGKGDIVVLIRDGTDPALLGVHAKTGELLFTTPLKSKKTSPPIIHHSNIYLVDGKNLKAFQLPSGEEKWQTSANLDASFFPVVSDRGIVGVDRNGHAAIFDVDSGRKIRTISNEGKLRATPLISGDHLVLTTHKKDGNGKRQPRMVVYNLESFQSLWSFDQIYFDFEILTAPSQYKDTIIVPMKFVPPLKQKAAVMLLAFDIRSGDIVWRTELANALNQFVSRPVITPDRIYTLYEDPDQPSVFVVDRHSGRLMKSLQLETHDEPLPHQTQAKVLLLGHYFVLFETRPQLLKMSAFI